MAPAAEKPFQKSMIPGRPRNHVLKTLARRQGCARHLLFWMLLAAIAVLPGLFVGRGDGVSTHGIIIIVPGHGL